MSEIALITIGMFLMMFVGLAWGLDICFLLGAIAVLFTVFLWGPHALGAITDTIFHWSTLYGLVCVPLFIFMAFVLGNSGIGDALYSSMHRWMGPLHGGLGIGTVGICTLFAAMSGGGMMACTTMGIVALPEMLKRGYDKHLAMGGIMAGSALGALIPPSIIMVIYALFAGESIGALFVGGIIPGLMLSAMFMIYIGVRCAFNPHLGPALPPGEAGSLRDKIVSLKSVILPVLLVLVILGSIFAGVATPTEAASVGAFGAIVITAINRKLNWQVIKEACIQTFFITATIQWIVYGASVFSMVYQALGAPQLISEIIAGLELNRWVILGIMQLTWFLLGFVIVNSAILMLTLPIYLPIIKLLGFDPLWFGLLFVINMEMAMLTPPFGFNLFYMRAVAPREISMADIYRSITPFVALQGLGLVLVMLFPELCLWLPRLMIRPAG